MVKIGLALGSGGIRGFAHISVIEFLEHENLRLGCVAGTSVGAIIGALYCYGSLPKFKDDFLRLKQRDFAKYFYPALSLKGLLNADTMIDWLKKYIPEDAKLEDLKIPLAIVATDYATGRPVVFKSGPILSAVRASISIPGLFTPVNYEHTILVDGGISDALPIDVVKEMGAERVIAVNLQPSVEKKFKFDSSRNVKLFESKPRDSNVTFLNRLNSGFAAFMQERLEKQSKPGRAVSSHNLFRIMSQSLQILMYHNARLAVLQYKPDVLIEPNLLEVFIMDPSKAQHAILEGRRAVMKAKKRIRILKSEN